MASGGYARKTKPQQSLDTISTRSPIPQRSTRQLPAIEVEDEGIYEYEIHEDRLEPVRLFVSKAVEGIRALSGPRTPLRYSATPAIAPFRGSRIVDERATRPLERHRVWLNKYVIGTVLTVMFALVLLSSAIVSRTDNGPQILDNIPGLGKVYDVQVGGAQAAQIQNTNGPAKQQVPLHTGPYNVVGKPTITASFIDQVLTAYGSPAAGKGQALYDLGVKYGIDPAFALAFFQHESTFGKFGEANSSLSLGNLRCIPGAQCTNNYAWFPSWESGFEAWYKLIRNLYVADWGLSTVPQIIPRYAPPADNNNDDAYIASVEHSIDVWHTGQIFT